MGNALLWGAVSGSAVMIGALLALFLQIRSKLIGFIMAFGTGVLIGAAAYELLEDSASDGGLTPTIIGFTAGALVFTLFDWLISRKGEPDASAQPELLQGKAMPRAEGWLFLPERYWMRFLNRS